ncbi:NTP transferase domain-containing protein [Rhizobium sp. CF142]|uniref:NTP transferase domain-containing protein n=1 Tax=Rhizobium sp. CF142 TaxID=1144314 RepID=UPI00026EE946|nr:molybdopterin-binding/glycosyltransferase family 2 protein [Rhizobium sp. CF142]EJJ31476.1 putative MobA-like protein [Rhizobium sp. CF142]
MRYGDFPIAEAEGIVLAHAIQLAETRLSKGKVLSRADLALLAGIGLSRITGVRLDIDDVIEDAAAAAIAHAIAPDNLRFSEPTTGRVNIYSRVNGLFVVDKAVVDTLNRIDSAITLACLSDHVAVRAGEIVATIKIIPLAVPGRAVGAAVRLLAGLTAFAVKAFRAHAVTLIATELPSLKASVMDKTTRSLAQRLAMSGSCLLQEIRIPHQTEALAQALRGLDLAGREKPVMVVVFGASAVADSEDVIPAAIRAAGGVVERVGMPVDPGNLMVLGSIGGVAVIGAPGCARSPKENGFDWILHRLMAGERPTSLGVSGMGVGGLLMEIPTRRKRGDGFGAVLAVGGILLAAGQARRMGKDGPHKLLAEFDGKSLVRHCAERLLAADVSPAVVVTGYRRNEIEAALSGLGLDCRFNPDYAMGMSTSLIVGMSSPGLLGCDGILVTLADMPGITTAHLNRLISAFKECGGRAVVRAVSEGKRGNPVILPRAAFNAVLRLEGDIGARSIVENSGLAVIDVEIGPAAHLDVDTPEAVIAAGGRLRN